MNDIFKIGYIYCAIAVVCAYILFSDAHTLSEITPRHTITRYVYFTFISAGLAAIFDCAYALREMEMVVFSQTSSYVLTLLYIIFSNLTGMFWILYSEKKQKSWFSKSKKNFLFLLIPFFLLLLAIISTPFTHCYFYFEDNHYQRGSLFTIISSVIFVFMIENGISALIRSLKKENYVDRNEFRRLFIFMVGYLLIQYIQLVLPDIFPYRSVGTMLLLNAFLQQNIKEMIGVDSLTRLNNRFEAERYLGSLMNNTSPFEMIMIDVDKFKSINDTYGHLEGDKALQYVADSLKKSVARGCFIARMGGDEFILLNNDLQNSILGIEDKINENLSKIFSQFNCQYKFTVSAGYSLKDDTINSIPDLIKAADDQLYIRKKQKNTNSKH